MYNIFAGPWLTNCIVWGSGSSPIFGGADIRYTDIQGGNAGVGNLNSDPLFVDADGADNVYGTADDDLRLRAGSPCLDAGSADVYLASDLEGNARFVDIPGAHDPGAIMDMGAYERQLPLVAGSGNLVLDGPAPSIKLNFNNVLLASTLAVDNVTVRTVLPGGSLGGTIAVTSVTYDPSSKSATFAIPVATPDGNYRATLLAGSISDTYGSSPAANFSFDFFILAADANHDRKVDVSDLHVLANNWGGSGKTFSQGDFNNDGTVGNADLAILAARWQFTLAAPTASLPASLAAPVRRTATRVVSLLS
jgi:hypothetical protein